MLKILKGRSEKRGERTLEMRRSLVRAALTSEISPVADRPYIEGGVYHWKYLEPITLDFVWPDVPLAVLVSEHIAPFGSTGAGRKLWEEGIAAEAESVAACRRAGMPLLVVGPNDPVDVHSITTRALEILEDVKQ